MRIRIAEQGQMYVRIAEGPIYETLELGGGCYLDVDEDGRVMGLEALSIEEFRALVERAGGELVLPERIEDPEAFEAEAVRRAS